MTVGMQRSFSPHTELPCGRPPPLPLSTHLLLHQPSWMQEKPSAQEKEACSAVPDAQLHNPSLLPHLLREEVNDRGRGQLLPQPPAQVQAHLG